MTVTICGHSKIENPDEIRKRLRDIIMHLISDGANTFLLGGYGEFDNLAAEVIHSLKDENPFIISILVIPYPDRTYPTQFYDETIYPPIENVTKRYAISARNKWMIDRADTVVAYITHSWGGAARAAGYAKAHRKEIISVN